MFRARLRLLPLAIALAAAALTFGALSLAGASLTMASIAVLPVLIGLAVDYAIQLQSRTQQDGVAAHGQRHGAPTVATAAAATMAGFLVLVLSPVPMVRGFGAAARRRDRARLRRRADRGDRGARPRRPRARRGGGAVVSPARRRRRRPARAGRPRRRRPDARPRRLSAARVAGAGRRRRAARDRAWPSGARSACWPSPAVLALAGWALDTQTKVESDVQKLVPQDLRALEDLNALQQATGVGGQLDVVVEADDVARARGRRRG